MVFEFTHCFHSEWFILWEHYKLSLDMEGFQFLSYEQTVGKRIPLFAFWTAFAPKLQTICVTHLKCIYKRTFWIWNDKRNTHGLVNLLRVHWLQTNEGIYDCTFNFVFVGKTKRNQSFRLETDVSDSIIVNYGSLKSKNRFPAAVHKKNVRSVRAARLRHHTHFLKIIESVNYLKEGSKRTV